MLILLCLLVLCSNFLFIKSEDTANMTIDIKVGENCTVNSDYTFTDGQTVNLVITAEKHINEGWCTLKSSAGERNISSNLKTTKEHEPTIYTSTVDLSMNGTWAFKFDYLQNISNNNIRLPTVHYNYTDYFRSVCQTNVKIVPKPTAATVPSHSYEKLLIIACSVGAVLVGIIIAQTVYIIFLKAEARKLITLNTHNNLSKRSDSVPSDTARYCSNPGQKIMKAPDPDDDSVVYEAPNIEISENVRMPMQPPPPPAITTLPRTPRPDQNMKIGPQAILASAMSSARSPMSDKFPPNFQRPKVDREVNLVNRPPLPLPPQAHPYPGHSHPGHPLPGHTLLGHSHPGHPHNDMFQEVYEDMDTEENTYEPPPVNNAMPPRLPMPPKKVPTGNFVDVKENTLRKRQGSKPLVTPKPQPTRPNTSIMTCNEFEEALRRRNNDTMPKPRPGHKTPMQQELARRRPNDAQTNELGETLRKRNNDHAQTNELEEALRRRNNGPPPAPQSKPRGPPVPQPVQEEIYYNDHQASSDEEWTYEPLKPLNSYDPNMYNV